MSLLQNIPNESDPVRQRHYTTRDCEKKSPIIKHEWLNRFKIRDYKQAYQLIFEYLEDFYNTKRIHSHCNYMLPNEFERVYERTHTEAELLAG